MTANLRIADSVESLLSYAEANAEFDLALTQAPAFRLSPPSFARIVKFHLPTLLREAEAGDQGLDLIPTPADTVGRCRLKLDALALELFSQAPHRTGPRLEMLLTAAFVVAGLRSYLELLATLEADGERLLRIIERQSGRTILRARTSADGDFEGEARASWWTRIGVRLRFLRPSSH